MTRKNRLFRISLPRKRKCGGRSGYVCARGLQLDCKLANELMMIVDGLYLGHHDEPRAR
jgi:hypothetical protein